MASPYLALMQSGALRRKFTPPMFGGPDTGEAVNPVDGQAGIADMTRGIDEMRFKSPATNPLVGMAGKLRGFLGRRPMPPIGRGMPGSPDMNLPVNIGGPSDGSNIGFVPPRGGFLGRPLPLSSTGRPGGNMWMGGTVPDSSNGSNLSTGMAPTPSPQATAAVPQPVGRLQRRMGSFGGGRGFLTNQGVY